MQHDRKILIEADARAEQGDIDGMYRVLRQSRLRISAFCI